MLAVGLQIRPLAEKSVSKTSSNRLKLVSIHNCLTKFDDYNIWLTSYCLTFSGEAVRLSGEYLPVDYGPRGKGFQSIVRRFPIGPVSMVSPWNFPLNLVAHKVG